MTNLFKRQILVFTVLASVAGVSAFAWANVPFANGNQQMYQGNQQQQFQSMPTQGFAAPQPQRVQEVPAYATGGNGCTTYRNDNTRMQNGQLMPAQIGGNHI